MENTNISKKANSKKLIERVLPEHHDQFAVEIGEERQQDYFYIKSSGKKIVLQGPNQVSIANALNWYLKYKCHSQVSFYRSQLELPKILPAVKDRIYHSANFKYRYYLNYCTFSYSMPWWNWEEWERMIDIMSMNGINLALAIIGQEAVWQNVLQKVGMSTSEIIDFLPGPAYLAWSWMGNLDSWGGPTTQNWINDQQKLQVKIVNRMRELGITPVLQAFTGRVPEKFKSIFPDAKIEQLPGWFEYEGVYFLDPDDPLLVDLTKMFIEEQTKLYGTHHFYAGDVFHEIDTPVDHDDYINKVYKGIQNALLTVDKRATWVLQSWDIRENNIDILDEEHVLILDLFCDSKPKWKNTNAFHGHPWIWSIINNFGGRVGLGGRLKNIARELKTTYNHDEKGRLEGIGMAPEGLNYNPIIFEFLMEMNWNLENIDLEEWVSKYAHSRYGSITDNIKKAWKLLLDTVFDGPESFPPVETVFCASPGLEIDKAGSNGSIKISYENKKLIKSLQYFLKDQKDFIHISTFVDDAVNICRQISANLGNDLYKEIMEAFNDKNLKRLTDLSGVFLELMLGMDELLESRRTYSVGNWIESARKKATDSKDLELLEWNAKTQITLWSSPTITEFHDYANKQWGGLMRSYYYPRWKMFLDELAESVENNVDPDCDKINDWILDWGEKWVDNDEEFPITNGKDSLKLANQLLQRIIAIKGEYLKGKE